MMDLTIVIPVKDRAGIVERTLRSVEAQTWRPLKVIVVDNGSADATRAIVEQWAQSVRKDDFTVTVIDEPRPGAALARNAGLEAVDTEWTMFFDSDDEMKPTHVERAAKCLEKHPDAGVIGWDVEAELPGGRKRLCPFFSSDLLYNNVLHGGFATQRYMARTKIFRKAGGWNGQMGIWDDIELGTRLLTMSPLPVIYKVNGAPQVLTHFTPVSISGDVWSDKVGKMLEAIGVMEALLPPKMRWIATLKRGQVARVCRKEGRADAAAMATACISGPWWQRSMGRLAAYVPTDLLRPWL